MALTNGSISGHNQNVKRLVSLGVIECIGSEIDKRVRTYRLKAEVRALIQNFEASLQGARSA